MKFFEKANQMVVEAALKATTSDLEARVAALTAYVNQTAELCYDIGVQHGGQLERLVRAGGKQQ